MKKFVPILFCFISFSAFSQNEIKIDSLKKLGKDSLIKLAVQRSGDKKIDPANYDRIIVRANKSSLVVEFSLSVQLITKKSCFYDHVAISLVGSGTSMNVKGDCDEPEFYSPSDPDKKKIQFVFDAINKSDEVGHLENNKISDENTMEITEHPGYYYVEISNWSTFSHYKVDKGTGKISEANHKHYAHDETESEKEVWEIIK